MSKKAIMCVDDEVIILLSIIQELKRSFGDKYLYEQAIDASSALDIVQELFERDIRVIFVITDWLMPGMKGDEFLEIIHERYPAIKAIMITGQADKQAIERIKEKDCVLAVFGKPWKQAEIVELITRHDDAD
jgi:CheY-like chemotaxis protein